MLTITEALIAEHRQFCALFDQIEQGLPAAGSAADVQALARRIEKLLRTHAAAEEDLVLLVLENAVGARQRCKRLYTDHQEIDIRLTDVFKVKETGRAAALLREAIRRSRRHFKHEEEVVFPLIEDVSGQENLTRWGAIWSHRREGLAVMSQQLLSGALPLVLPSPV
jgi:hemerythrin superfamily protein